MTSTRVSHVSIINSPLQDSYITSNIVYLVSKTNEADNSINRRAKNQKEGSEKYRPHDPDNRKLGRRMSKHCGLPAINPSSLT